MKTGAAPSHLRGRSASWALRDSQGARRPCGGGVTPREGRPHAIHPEVLWQAVKDRLKTSRASYLRASNGQLWGRPGNGIDSKYLLTGLAQCGVCGGGLIAHSRASGPRRKYAYLCSYYHLRGTTVCPTGVLVPMDEANQAVLETFERRPEYLAHLSGSLRTLVRR